ncbi:restriction endonuclease subunit S [Caldibacillus thermoamylovorans]|jgi:type I restriction enzyme, S subunit|nr:restriction endonuclease subunit S [Caldibacillus thermoamylovorans]
MVKIQKVSEVCEIIMGQSPPSDSYNDKGIGMPFFQGKSEFGELNPTPKWYCSSPIRLAEVDDILISVRAPVGDVNIANVNCCIGRGLAAIRPDKTKLLTKFLFYVLKGKKREIENMGTGSTFKAISKKDLVNIKIPVPNIEIQKKIVNTFDKAQELIDKRKAQIEALDQLTQSVFLEMFGSIQGEKLPLSELCEINPPKREVADLKEDTIVSFIPMANVSENGEIDLSETRNLGEVYKGFTYFKENDVLFAKITPCMENGKGAIAKNLTNEVGFGSTEFHVLRPKEGITSEWLYYLTTLPNFRQQAEKNMTGSAGQKRVPKQFFDKYKVNKPTIESQEEFKKIILKINSQKEMLKKSLAILDTNFQSLMQRAFKGELFTEEKVSNL